MNHSVRLGTRGSALARWQAEWVASELRRSGVDVELVLITTTGDVSQESLKVVGGQGVFTKEIQRALLDRRIDLAVHSLKDLPTEKVPGLTLAAVPPRESPHDVLVRIECSDISELPTGARIGTGSRRRQSQLLHYRADLQVKDIRGNVDTRLRKLEEGEYDAIILAEAGLNRLGLADRIAQVIPTSIMLPAIGQGALGIETREDDERTQSIVAILDDATTHASVLAERAMLSGLQGGCLAPIAAWGRIDGTQLRLSGAVLSIDGRTKLSVELTGSTDRPEQLGQQAAAELLGQGAAELVAASRLVEPGP